MWFIRDPDWLSAEDSVVACSWSTLSVGDVGIDVASASSFMAVDARPVHRTGSLVLVDCVVGALFLYLERAEPSLENILAFIYLCLDDVVLCLH